MFQLKSKSTHSVNINNDKVQSNLIKPCDDLSINLLEKYSNLNLSIESLESIESSERRGSAISDITFDSKYNLGTLSVEHLHDCSPSDEGLIKDKANLDTGGKRSKLNAGVDFIEQFNSNLKHYTQNIYILNITHLVDLLDYTYSLKNELDSNDTLFPYLHGLNNSRQRIFFNKKFKTLNDDNFDINEYKEYDQFDTPDLKQFHLMCLNTEDEEYKLINSVSYDEVLESLEDMKSLKLARDGELNNRNFKSQVHLYSTFSNFLIYNNSCNFASNLKRALILSKSISNNQRIYVVDFNCKHWKFIPQHYVDEYNYKQINSLPINSINNQVFNCKLLKWEQNLLWKYNSMRWLNKNICLGNLIDYNYISNIQHDFKLVINCNEYGSIPKRVESYMEFPSSGYLHFQYLNLNDLLNYLNLLKTIEMMVESNEQIFIFSFEGFTGLTLLTLSISLMLNKKNLSLEEMILDIYGNDEYLKLYYFKNDLVLLKKIEKYIHYSKTFDVGEKVTLSNYKEIPSTISKPENIDWFDWNKENNMPCKIFKSLYLGSVNHVNSKSVLNCMKFARIISVGEQPKWLKLNQPIYGYENEQGEMIEVYEIKINRDDLPHLKSVIFIKNLKDDGKDSILHLLMNSPRHIQAKFLINPNQPTKTFYHCKIGVSRSASLVIASLMKYQKLSLIESYMIVRINRFNIIIQPNLRILYDLYLFEEHLNRHHVRTRQYAWYSLCDEIYKLNRNYIE